MIKLLIVDDEPLVQIGIKSMINWTELGIEVCGTAMNGQAALEMIREYAPELVITDIKMPIMNGLDLVKACRDELGPIPLFLVLTSYEEFELVRKALSYQVVDYMIKLELEPESLRQAVSRALERLKQLKESAAYRQSAGRPLLQSYHDKFLCVFFTIYLTAGNSFPFRYGIFVLIFPISAIWPATVKFTAEWLPS